jgi:hypothetical protein
MDKKKSQLYNFTHEALPIVFHSQTDEFMKYLEQDGLDFLKFWWDHVGIQLQVQLKLKEEELAPFEGVDFKIIPINEKKKVTIITFPPPRENDEIFYVGLISSPEKRFAWVKLPTQRALALVYRPLPSFPRQTEIGDLTPRGIFVPMGAGPEPDLEKFTAIVMRIANNKLAPQQVA